MVEVVVEIILHRVIDLPVNYVGSMVMLLFFIGRGWMKPLHTRVLNPTYQIS